MLLHGVDLLAFFTVWGLALMSWIVGGSVLVRLWNTRRRTRRRLVALLFVSTSSAVVAAVLIDDGVLQHPNLLGLAGLAPVALSCAALATWCRASSAASAGAVDPRQASR
jgi:peptidoglycan/LPS O-acetylase OafA/YrhL